MDACARRRATRPIPLMFGNFAIILYQVSEVIAFFVSKQRPITATEQRENSGTTATFLQRTAVVSAIFLPQAASS
jgi:hypothetical protein